MKLGALPEPEANERSARRQIAADELPDDPDGAAPGDLPRRHADQLDLCRDDDVNLARHAGFERRSAAVAGLDDARRAGGELSDSSSRWPGCRRRRPARSRPVRYRVRVSTLYGLPGERGSVRHAQPADDRRCPAVRRRASESWVTTCGMTTTRIVFRCATRTCLPCRATVAPDDDASVARSGGGSGRPSWLRPARGFLNADPLVVAPHCDPARRHRDALADAPAQHRVDELREPDPADRRLADAHRPRCPARPAVIRPTGSTALLSAAHRTE